MEVEINWKAVNNNSRLGNDKADKVSRDCMGGSYSDRIK